MNDIEDLLKSYPTVHLGFEATVGGGTPILHTLQTYYNSDDITRYYQRDIATNVFV